MTAPTLLVSQSGQLTQGLSAIVSAHSDGPVTTFVTDRPEDNQYYLSPATVEAVEQRCSDSDDGPATVVVDGEMHPGQSVDLQTRLSPVTVRDKRAAVWEWLGEANPVAATCLELQQARIARRGAAAEQRDAAEQGPSGTSGSVTAHDERIQELRDTLEKRRTAARQRVQTSYSSVDGRVVLLGRVSAPTTPIWAALTETTATATVGRPAQPTTATATVGPHTLAVTDTPGILGSHGVPDWLQNALPGLTAAIEQATCVLGVGEGCETLLTAVAEEFDVRCRTLPSDTESAARDALDTLLETSEFAVKLPYSDAAHALVSDLHGEATVHATEYDDAIYVRVEVSQATARDLHRRVSEVDGDVQPYNSSE